MAGGVPYGEEHRTVQLRGPTERLLPPRIPIHWIMGMLPQIWALLIDQPVRLPFFGGTIGHRIALIFEMILFEGASEGVT
jgi:hypothetical protein